MNKKGFTLIELVTVIVVLAIITLIVIPITTNVVENSKKSAAKSSALNYIKAVEATNALVELPGKNNEFEKIIGTKNIKKIKVSSNGRTPDSGLVQVDNDGKVQKAELCIDGYHILYEGSKITEIEKQNECTVKNPNFGGTIVEATSTDTHKGIVYMDPTNLKAECNASNSVSTTGTKSGCMKFYIFDDSGSKYKMILDHNTTAKVAYETSGTYKEYDQASIKSTVDSDTTGWVGNPRLITANEIATITDTTTFDGSSSKWFYFNGTGDNKQTQASSSQGDNEYAWLFDYTNGCTGYGCNTADSSTNGYWTSSSVLGNSNFAWSVNVDGSLYYNRVEIGNYFGVRPVIEIKKSVIDGDSLIPEPKLFETDSWATIASNTTSDKYNVGDTKCIKLNGFTTTNNNGCSNGEFKVRIANKTACTTEESKTACGFVVEFVDIISTHNMNPSGEYKGTQYSYGWNVDGYPASAMYQEYFTNNATNSIYSKLPSDLQDEIIDTKVVSGHGSTTGETNFTSTDKLYLLSRQEVYGDNKSYDTATSSTRQLDYYNANNNNESRVKQYNGSNNYWWLRTPLNTNPRYFHFVFSDGSSNTNDANYVFGVSPAFRIGTN